MANIAKAVGWDAAGTKHQYEIIGGDNNSKVLKDGSLGVPGYTPNQNKVVHLCFYRLETNQNILSTGTRTLLDSITSNSPQGNYWDNWRDGKSTILNFGDNSPSIMVPTNIYPTLENFTIKGGFEIGSLSAAEQMKNGSTSILEGINNAAGSVAKLGEMINFGVNAATNAADSVIHSGEGSKARALLDATKSSTLAANAASGAVQKGAIISKFDDFPIFNAADTKAVTPGEISLGFSLGNGNYFDGELEVVRPIAAIENKIIPVLETPNQMYAPMGSPAQFSAAVWGASAGIISDLISSTGETLSNAAKNMSGGIAQAATSLGSGLAQLGYDTQTNVMRAKDAAVAALGHYTTFLFMRLGNSTLGPFYVTGCNHSFDYTQVDEKGYPYKGTISIQIKYIGKPNNYDNLTQMGYLVTYPSA